MDKRALQALGSTALMFVWTAFAPVASAEDSGYAELRALLAQQQQQIEQLRKALEEQKKLLEATIKTADPGSTQPSSAPTERLKPFDVGQVASRSPILPAGIAPKPLAIPPAMPVASSAAQAAAGEASPLQ